MLDQARANLDLLKAGTRAEDIAALEAQVAQTRARLQEVEVNLAEAVVHSPGKAVVNVVSVRKGDLVSPGQAVVRILRADDLWVKIFVPETDLGLVVLGQAVEVTVDSHPGVRFPGASSRSLTRASSPRGTSRASTSAGIRSSPPRSASTSPAACSSRAWPPRSRSRLTTSRRQGNRGRRHERDGPPGGLAGHRRPRGHHPVRPVDRRQRREPGRGPWRGLRPAGPQWVGQDDVDPRPLRPDPAGVGLGAGARPRRDARVRGRALGDRVHVAEVRPVRGPDLAGEPRLLLRDLRPDRGPRRRGRRSWSLRWAWRRI